MQIVIVDKDELEAYLQSRFGDKLRTGKQAKSDVKWYFQEKQNRFLHDHKGARG